MNFRGVFSAVMLVSLVALAVIPSAAEAVILPGTQVSQTADGSVTSSPPQSAASSNTMGGVAFTADSSPGYIQTGNGTASGSIAGTPFPNVSGQVNVQLGALPASVLSTSGFGGGFGYNGSLIYYFEVLGPTQSAPVQALGSAQITSSALSANARMEVLLNLSVGSSDSNGTFGLANRVFTDTSFFEGASPDLHSANITGSSATGFTGGFTESGIYQLQTNTVYQVGLQDILSISLDGSYANSSASASSFIDPTFSIAANTPQADQYRFIFSDGIGNTQPTPGVAEPSSWALMIVGFGLIAMTSLRGRKRISGVS